jgi:hypothetical protein
MTLELPDSAFQLGLAAFVETAFDHLDQFDWPQEDDMLFHLVRALKAHPSLTGMDAAKAYSALAAGTRKTRGAGILADFGYFDEDGMVAFYRTWERARFAMGTDPVEAACGLAGNGMIRTQNERPGRYSRFLTVGALLQIQVRQQPILLPSRKIAEYMPCQPNTVTAWVGWAIEDGVLLKTRDHAYRSQGESRAAEYVFGLHLWKPETHKKLGSLVGLTVRAQDLRWIENEFASAQSESDADDPSPPMNK